MSEATQLIVGRIEALSNVGPLNPLLAPVRDAAKSALTDALEALRATEQERNALAAALRAVVNQLSHGCVVASDVSHAAAIARAALAAVEGGAK